MRISSPLAASLLLAAATSPASTADQGPRGLFEPGSSAGEWTATGASQTGSESRYGVDLTGPDLGSMITSQQSAGRDLVDVEVRWDGLQYRFAAVFYPLPAGSQIHTLIVGNATAWNDFIADMQPRNGRYLDVEVGYYGGVKRWSAIFYEDGDDYAYAIYSTNSDAQLQNRLDTQIRAGRSIVDFEAYLEPDDDLRFAGVWVSDPNQPRTVLHYHLTSAELSDLIRPLAGRLIDFERYWSPLHEEYRYAVITAMYPGGGWGLWRGASESSLATKHGETADADTHLIDIEEWNTASGLRYAAIWGDTYKSLHEVPLIPADTAPEATPPNLANTISTFEANAQGTIGIYAKNLRTDQSLGYRQNEPFYLASSTKVAVHIKLWQEIQAGLDPATTIPYTACADCRNDWYVDERDTPAGSPGFGNTDFGQSFSLERFDRAMMQRSDNAATSALVDHPTIGVSWDAVDLNEWLSGVAGVGQGWFPITSIHDLDRTILWQGQVEAFPDETSFFLIPGWAFEPWFRSSPRTDVWGDLSDFLGNPASLPQTDIRGEDNVGDLTTDGYTRYYNQGLNSGTPKAFANLLEGLWEGRFHDATNRQNALTRMTEGTFLDNQIPGNVTVYAKGGSKGGTSDPRNNTAIFELGPDAIAVGVFTKDNVRSPSNPDNIRAPFFPGIGLDVLQGLAANLFPDPTAHAFGPSTVWAGKTFEVTTVARNQGGGDSFSPFDVTFYASTNTTIGATDRPIGTVRVLPIAAGGARFVRFQGEFPANIPPGSYYVGFDLDTSGDDVTFGEVGEWDETDNTGYVDGKLLTVIGTDIFSDGFESGGVAAWSSAVGATP